MKWTTHLMENLMDGDNVMVSNGFEIRDHEIQEVGERFHNSLTNEECIWVEVFRNGNMGSPIDRIVISTETDFYGVPSILELDCELFSLIVTGGYDAPMDAEAAAFVSNSA